MRRRVAVVPAAGRSERFGSMKLVADVGGEPLLDRTLRSLLDAGFAPVIVVVSPAAALERVTLLRDARVRVVVNPDPSRGMFSSIRTGLAEADGDVIAILPADMPVVRSETIRRLEGAAVVPGRAVVPLYNGKRGHPLVLPGSLREALLGARAEVTLKEALASAAGPPDEIPVDDPGVVRDVDTKDDLDQLRS